MEGEIGTNESSASPTKSNPNQNTAQIAGAIIVAGIIIAGAIMIRGSSAPRDPNAQSNNVPLFSKCLESGKYSAKVEADIVDANKMGAQGTPSSFILVNSRVVDTIPGAQQYEKVVAQLEKALVTDGSTGTPMQGRAISQDDHIIGNLNAKVIILEYSDLECPFCKVFHATMHRVVKSNPNVAWVYRHYPIPQLHTKAMREAEATECAWEQGGNEAFWKYTDRLFEVTLSNDRLDSSELPKIAEYVGLK